MLRLNGRTILLGGFHDHWSRADAQNPAVLLAALNYYHYDFVTLMCGPEFDSPLQAVAEAFSDRLRIYLGREEMFGWAHVVTVGPRAASLPPSDPDYRSVLQRLKQTCDLVLLAHPPHIAWEPLVETGEMDRLLDEGLLDGVELTLDHPEQPESRDARLLQWYRQGQQRGKRTAVIGGWDVHQMRAIRNVPSVLYGRQFVPDGHFEASCSSRTILLAEENSLPAICAAVKAGQTVVEHLPSGRLFGPAELVEFLQSSGYHKAIAEMDESRDAVRLEMSEPLMAGGSGRLTVSRSGRLRLPVTLNSAHAVEVVAGKEVAWPTVPALLQRDVSYLPVVWQDPGGQERIWAVECGHPIQLEILPVDGGTGVEVVPLRPFSGEVELRIDGTEKPVRQTIQSRTRLDVSLPADAILHYKLTARNQADIVRSFEGFLTCFGVRRFRGDWSRVPRFGVDQRRFIPLKAYGIGRIWPGPETYSGQLQIAWTSDALLMRATVRDAVHFQPFCGHYMYNADCLQLSIDPLLRRADTLGNVYSFLLGLTKAGPELYRIWGPDAEASDTFPPPSADVSLGDRFLQIKPWEGGLVYELTLPWAELAPAQPRIGQRMGIYFIMFNNDGTGHLDTLHWPVPIDGTWTKPKRWGVVTLLD